MTEPNRYQLYRFLGKFDINSGYNTANLYEDCSQYGLPFSAEEKEAIEYLDGEGRRDLAALVVELKIRAECNDNATTNT